MPRRIVSWSQLRKLKALSDEGKVSAEYVRDAVSSTKLSSLPEKKIETVRMRRPKRKKGVPRRWRPTTPE